jgi:hypothetical protein
MPFTNFPARTMFDTVIHWERLRSGKERGEPRPGGDFEQLRWSHVFAYAGPSCYFSRHSTGDAVLYFKPALDTSQQGTVSPFDSGALEDPTPKLQPWAPLSLPERWQFLQDHVHPLQEWRERFEQWLVHCYRDPARYLDTLVDRYTAGTPDRTLPPELLEHNGPNGLLKYPAGPCADRRAWTWEARFEGPVFFRHLQAVHVARDRVQAVRNQLRRLRPLKGLHIKVVGLPRKFSANADTLYEDSGRVLRKLVEL